MAIGIGLHCWHCDHGPCSGECKGDEKERDAKKKGFNDGISRAQLAVIQQLGLTHDQKTKLWDELDKLRWK
jgi:hypothetical protein